MAPGRGLLADHIGPMSLPENLAVQLRLVAIFDLRPCLTAA